MKIALHVLTLSTCAMLLLGCGHKGSDGHAEGHSTHGESAHAAEAKPATGHAGHAATPDGDDRPASALTLNKGEKWPMDDHTRAALGTIEARLKAGPATDDVAGHHALGRDLDAEIKALIQGCTMKGEAHDQLHVWLMAFIPAVGALQTSDDLDALRKGRLAIEGHVSAARAHFR